MKGLIIKDLLCLKKQMMTYIYIVLGVVAVAIMFVLSTKYGNLADVAKSIKESGIDVRLVLKVIIMFFMVLPVACMSNVSALFEHDKNASFYKVAASMPVPVEKRVLSRFLTIIAFAVVGIGIDTVLAAVISGASDVIVFSKCVCTLISIASCILMYMSAVNMLNFFGTAPVYSTFIPIITAVVAVIAINLRSIVRFLTSEDPVMSSDSFRKLVEIFENRCYIIVLIAAVFLTACYFISVAAAKRKRGAA